MTVLMNEKFCLVHIGSKDLVTQHMGPLGT